MSQPTDRGTTCIHGTATGTPCGNRLDPRSTFYCSEHLSEPAKRWRPSR